jgi:hypothetical protein
MNLKWRRTDGSIIRDDDWSLLDTTGDRIARLFNTGDDDLIGVWRWRVWLTRCKKEVRELEQKRERLALAEHQQTQIAQR